jgi:hypothetical protein
MIYDQEELEDTKWVIRFCKSEKERQHNSPKETKTKRTNNDLQDITHKT